MTKVIFMGTPNISAKVLETLYKINDVKLFAVISQPDKELNRKKEIVYSPVKQFCIDKNINLLQPIKISQIKNEIQQLNPDIIITCAYGQFIPNDILKLPKLGCFNLHASILPNLRGGAPIHWAIINGMKETGITLMEMIVKMDAGNIIDIKKCNIDENDTTKTLTLKLTNIACDVLKNNWNKLISQNYKSIAQDENLVTFGLNIKKEDCILDFNNSCENIYNKIRGLNDKPVAIWIYENNHIKVWEANKTNIVSSKQSGSISKINKDGIFVCTNDFDIQLTKIQLPNKVALNVSQIINGNHIFKVS